MHLTDGLGHDPAGSTQGRCGDGARFELRVTVPPGEAVVTSLQGSGSTDLSNPTPNSCLT